MKALHIFLGLMSFSVTCAPDFSKLDEYLHALSDNDKLMFSVTVQQNDNVVYEKHLGLVSQRPKLHINADTQFRIGSVTKTFTATLIMQLIEAKKLSLDTPLDTYFSHIKHADKITISDLLSHRSGIANFTDEPDFRRYMVFPQSPEKMLKIIQGMDSLFEPGSDYQYSNSNYVLLGFIIEKVTQRPFAHILQQYIAKPLSLRRTSYGEAIDVNANQARSFRFNGFWQTLPESSMTIPHGAGAIISTSDELNQFIQALFKGKLLPIATVKKMIKLRDNYGFGFYSFPYRDKKFIGHNGRIDGFLSVMAIQPEDNVSISLLANGVNYAFDDVLVAVLDSVYGKDIKIPDFTRQSKTYRRSELQKLVGLYTSDTLPLDINVFIENGQLHAQATNQRALQLEGYENLEFGFALAGITMKFELMENDSVKFMLIQGGGKHQFIRD